MMLEGKIRKIQCLIGGVRSAILCVIALMNSNFPPSVTTVVFFSDIIRPGEAGLKREMHNRGEKGQAINFLLLHCASFTFSIISCYRLNLLLCQFSTSSSACRKNRRLAGWLAGCRLSKLRCMVNTIIIIIMVKIGTGNW